MAVALDSTSFDPGLEQQQATHTAVLLDPHPLWLEALEHVLGRIGVQVVGKASSPREALAELERLSPDLLVTELAADVGEADFVAWLRRFLQEAPRTRAIVLSRHDNPDVIDAVLQAGAAAYIVKTAHPDDLAAAVRQVFDHSVYLGPIGVVAADPVPTAERHDLTRRELEILRLLVEGHSNAQLARMLWVTEQTVKFHLSNVYRKIGVSNRTEASRWAQLHGLIRSSLSVSS
jgi:DNA-binding NarL/FixJ family response regulator